MKLGRHFVRLIDLTGKQFSRLLVISRGGNNAHGQVTWNCKCSCGNTAVVEGNKLKNEHTKSCGCIKDDRMRELAQKRKRTTWICAVDGCSRKASGKYCGTHAARLRRYGRLHLTRRENGLGNIGKNGYVDMHVDGRRVYEHVLVAEKALGKKLPHGAVAHHVNRNRADNRPSNLVICPNEKYHRLLHKRMRELGI